VALGTAVAVTVAVAALGVPDGVLVARACVEALVGVASSPPSPPQPTTRRIETPARAMASHRPRRRVETELPWFNREGLDLQLFGHQLAVIVGVAPG
jgi:hypothetical protein